MQLIFLKLHLKKNSNAVEISVRLLSGLNSINSLIILKMWVLPFAGGMYSSTLSVKSINPTLSLF